MKQCKLCYVLMILVGLSVILSTSILAVISNVQMSSFNLTFTGNQNQSVILPVPSYGYMNNLSFNLNFRCSQEYFNLSACNNTNLNETRFINTWSNPSNIFDGNYNTYGTNGALTDVAVYVNYSISNLEATAFVSIGGTGTEGTKNLTLQIPRECLTDSTNKLKIYMVVYKNEFRFDYACLNEDALVYLYTSDSGSIVQSLFEERIIWGNNNSIFNSTIYANNVRIGFSNYTYNNVSLNVSPINNLLYSNLPVNISFYSGIAGILPVNLKNATYSYGIDNCSNSFNIPSNATALNVSYYDDTLLSLININSNGILYYGANNYNFTQTNINKQFFCIYPSWNTQTVTGQIFYSKEGYASKVYNLDGDTTLFFGNLTQNLNLYLTNLSTSTVVKINWLTNQYIAVTGSLYTYKCNGDGSKTLVETSDIANGVSYSNLNLLNTLYSYSVLYNGVLYEDFNSYSKCHIESSSEINYFISVENTDNTQPIGMYSIICNMTNTSANTVKMSWSNNPFSNLPITGCIFAYRNGINGWIQIYSDCSNSSNSLERTVPVTGYEYEIRGRIYQGGYSIACVDTVDFYGNKPAATTFGLMGLFSIAFLIIGIAFFFIGDDIKQTTGAIIAILLAWFMGLWNFDWKTISAICAFLIMIMLIGRSASKR